MTELFRGRLFRVWLVLVAVTLLSAVMGGKGGVAQQTGGAAVACTVLAIAFAKAGLVMFEFMELRSAPTALRALAMAWLSIVLFALLATYFGALGLIIRSV